MGALLVTGFYPAAIAQEDNPTETRSVLTPTVITPTTPEPVFTEAPPDKELIAHNSPGQNWEGPHVRELKSFKAMKKALKKSKREPILIFKHSTICPINARAAYRFNQWIEDQGDDKPKIYFVKVIESRPVSLELAKNLSVKHESPQILLIKDGESRWDTSHEDITAENIDKALEELHEKKPKE